MWGRLRKERHCTVTRWSLTAHCCLFRMGPGYGLWAHSVNRLRWLRMVCVDIQTLWHPGVSETVWDEYANPLTAWFLEVAHYMDGSRWSQSLVVPFSRWSQSLWCLNHRIVVCGTLKCLAICNPQAGLKHTHCPFSVDDGEGPSKSFFIGMKCEVCLQCPAYKITDVQTHCLFPPPPENWKCPILS